MNKQLKNLTIICLAIMSANIAAGKVIRVPGDYPVIQEGVDAAGQGDTVLVADGVYLSPGSNREIVDFKGKAITLKSENGPSKCILSKACYLVVFKSGEGHNSILSGFTLESADPGAAIYCKNSSPLIINNIFANNWSEYGEGVVHLDHSSAVLINNIFYDNRVYGDCAGIVCENNTSAQIVNNTFLGHEPGELYSGATGALCDSTSTAQIVNSILWNTGALDFKNCLISYSCLDKTIFGEGNISSYPEFKNAQSPGFRFGPYQRQALPDLSLKTNSRCIQSGSVKVIGHFPEIGICVGGKDADSGIDMGALGFQEGPVIIWK